MIKTEENEEERNDDGSRNAFLTVLQTTNRYVCVMSTQSTLLVVSENKKHKHKSDPNC